MGNLKGAKQKTSLRPDIDIKLGIKGADTKFDLISATASGGNIPPINPGDNVVNGLLTQASDFLITQNGDYLVWS